MLEGFFVGRAVKYIERAAHSHAMPRIAAALA
jgi:hypothetical protein